MQKAQKNLPAGRQAGLRFLCCFAELNKTQLKINKAMQYK
jgi:hypothetical protein